MILVLNIALSLVIQNLLLIGTQVLIIGYIILKLILIGDLLKAGFLKPIYKQILGKK